MPQSFNPQRSGVHRAACFALYRALLRRTRTLSSSLKQSTLNWNATEDLRNVFKRNARLQSPKDMAEALNRGYTGLDVLQDTTNTSRIVLGAWQKLLDKAVFEAPRRPAHGPKPSPSPEERPKTSDGTFLRNGSWTKATSILDRPFPVVSGRRSVPHLINAGGTTFLRYKKPQPEIMTQMIRHNILANDRRWTRTYALRQLVTFGELEDAWDQLLERNCGLKRRKYRSTSWATESAKAEEDIHTFVKRHAKREAEMSSKMRKIRDEEHALAVKEKAARASERERQRDAEKAAQQEYTPQLATMAG